MTVDCGCGGGPVSCVTYGAQIRTFFAVIGVTFITLFTNFSNIAKAAIIGLSAITVDWFYNDSKITDFILEKFSFLKENNEDFKYHLITDSVYETNLVSIKSDKYMKGDANNNKFIASIEGSYIFPGAGLNLAIASFNEDHFYYSMCSTKIYNGGHVNQIMNFETSEDKIHLFCTKRQILPEDVNIIYYKNHSYIEINDPKGLIAIAVNGQITMDDIVLNDRWDHDWA